MRRQREAARARTRGAMVPHHDGDRAVTLNRIFTASVLAASAAMVSTHVLAADAQTCQRYANQADKDSLYRERGCPQIPDDARWRRDRTYHYDWCLKSAASALEPESEARRNALIACGIIYKETRREHF